MAEKKGLEQPQHFPPVIYLGSSPGNEEDSLISFEASTSSITSQLSLNPSTALGQQLRTEEEDQADLSLSSEWEEEGISTSSLQNIITDDILRCKSNIKLHALFPSRKNTEALIANAVRTRGLSSIMLGPAEDSNSSSSSCNSDRETESDEDEKRETFPDISDTNTTVTTSSFVAITASNDIIDDTTEDMMRNYGTKQLHTPGEQAFEEVARTAIIPSISISLTEALNEMEMLTVGESILTVDNASDTSVTANNNKLLVGGAEPLDETHSSIDTNNTVTHGASHTDNTRPNEEPITNELLSLGNVPTEEKITLLLNKVHSVMYRLW